MIAEIGESAGKVWDALAANGSMTATALRSQTKLDPEMLSMALGWLAREDKVVLEKMSKKRIQVALK